MINILNQLFQSRLFFWVRISQFVVAVCIFTFAALMPTGFIQVEASDKSMHFLGNALLFLSAYVASGGRLKLWLLGLLLIPYSILIEASQWLTVTRQVDPKDAVANVSGLITGCTIAFILDWTWKKVNSSAQQRDTEQ